jgi:hypothetical protein
MVNSEKKIEGQDVGGVQGLFQYENFKRYGLKSSPKINLKSMLWICEIC